MNKHNILPLAIGIGWTVVKNNLIETGNITTPSLDEKHASSDLLLKLQCKHSERRKFSFQDYLLSITVEAQRLCNCNMVYKISAHMQPCDNKIYLLENALCTDMKSVLEKVNCFADQYKTPHEWYIHQIKFIYSIWDAERRNRNVKSMIAYPGKRPPHNPLHYVPIKIPAGWNVALNSFLESYTFEAPSKQQTFAEFYWDRDVLSFTQEFPDYIIFLELQEYICSGSTTSLLRVTTYFDTKDGEYVFEELESVFCFSVKEAQEHLNKLLWKYKNGIQDTPPLKN